MQSSSPHVQTKAELGAALTTSASTFSIIAKSKIPLHSWIALNDEIRQRKSVWAPQDLSSSRSESRKFRKSVKVQTNLNPKDIIFKQRECIKALRKENSKLRSLLIAYRKADRKLDVDARENNISSSNGGDQTVESLDAILDDLSDFTYHNGIKPVYEKVIRPSEKLMRQAVETVKDTIVDMLDELPKDLAKAQHGLSKEFDDMIGTSDNEVSSPLRVVELRKSSKRRPTSSRAKTKRARSHHATGSGLLIAPKFSRTGC